MKYLFCLALIILFVCSSSSPWLSYNVRYIGTEKEMDIFIEELLLKGMQYRVIVHDSGLVYEIHYRILENPSAK